MAIAFEPHVFTLSEVAEILAIPETRVKNWTIGRPLKIRPSIAARGTGSRNLYRLHDICRFAIANQLHQNGFRPQVIQRVLDAGKEFTNCNLLVIPAGVDWTKNRTNLEVQLIDHAQYLKEGLEIIHRSIAKSIGCFVLNTLSLTNRVDAWAEDFLGGHPHGWQESHRPAKPRVLTREDK